MTWTIFAKDAKGAPVRCVMVGAPQNEAEVREYLKGSHPDFVPETIVQGDVDTLETQNDEGRDSQQRRPRQT